ncbi:MAG TPA: cyclic nucleotide-binding domain-containing protein, partial [Candidatus Coatesbacteria bacterium]|nr:cyclic nucleotide-binding domain-containing protein [Candidatus Coatesbacteria bacterium]
ENHLYLLAYNDFSIDYRIRFYINDYSQVNRIKAEVMNRLWYAFQRAGITIPFPIRNVYLHRPQEEGQEERALESAAARLELLRGVDLFASLEPDVLERLARAFKTRMYAVGEAPVRQGEEGDSFYLVKSGRFDIFVKKDRERHRYGVKVAELGPGSFFGEMSLLTGEARTATVVAREPGEVCALGKEDFREILLTRPEVSAQLAAAASERVTRNLAQLSKYLTEKEQKTMAEKEKKDHVRQAIMGQMRQFFGF